MKQGRGQLTDRIKACSKEMLGYEIDEMELRFMAYFQFVMINEQQLNKSKMRRGERALLINWKLKEYVTKNRSHKLKVTKKFWNALCEIIFLGYVDLR